MMSAGEEEEQEVSGRSCARRRPVGGTTRDLPCPLRPSWACCLASWAAWCGGGPRCGSGGRQRERSGGEGGGRGGGGRAGRIEAAGSVPGAAGTLLSVVLVHRVAACETRRRTAAVAAPSKDFRTNFFSLAFFLCRPLPLPAGCRTRLPACIRMLLRSCCSTSLRHVPVAARAPAMSSTTAPLAPVAAPAPARPLSPSALHSPDAMHPVAKRQRTGGYGLDSPSTSTKTPRKRSVASLPYHSGMHLAPMVRIGTLPLRLIGAPPPPSPFFSLSPSTKAGAAGNLRTRDWTDRCRRTAALEYGAELVWGPEIVDKAIIGAERKVDRQSCQSSGASSRARADASRRTRARLRRTAARTGVVSFCKNGRPIFECHPLEKSRLVFQLGSASPELAVQAIKVIENDVAGVGLNCGCPKSFSLQGGMGAALLKEPEKLCSVRTTLVLGSTSFSATPLTQHRMS